MTGRTHVFTSAALNYVGKARALLRSIRTHHPEFICHLLLPERREAASGFFHSNEPFDDLAFVTDLPSRENPSWLFKHSIVELATAIKAPYAAQLLDRSDCARVVYLDPDIVLFSRLDDVLDALDQSSIALTPHLLEPEEEIQAVRDNEMAALKHGAFNLGFFALRKTSQAERFVKWWATRTEWFCFDEVADGLFTDQKWIDLAPAFFEEIVILRSPRLNVAPWNLGRRNLVGSFDEGFRVDGEPLGFYHFTGFDSGAHRRMAKRYAPDNAAVKSLIDWYKPYADFLGPDAAPAWSLGHYHNGTVIEKAHRRLYRTRPDLQAEFPDPFQGGRDSYLSWFKSSAVE